MKGLISMIDALYNYRQGDIHSTEFSDDFNKLCIPFEDSLSEEHEDSEPFRRKLNRHLKRKIRTMPSAHGHGGHSPFLMQ